MNAPTRSRADVAVLLLIAFMLAALLAPALAASNAQSDKQLCLSRMRDLSIALYNAHDTYGGFPLASSKPLDHFPGTDGEKPSGYSWLTRLLPFVEQVQLYNNLADASTSNKLTVPPFNPAVTRVHNRLNRAVMAVPLQEFVCPGSIGDTTVGDGAPEYSAFPVAERPAKTSYFATSGTHFINQDGLGRMVQTEQEGKAVYEGNGVIIFLNIVDDRLARRGINVRSITDGSSNTFTFSESNERNYAAWIDGQATWLVSAWPSNPDLPISTDDENGLGWKRLSWIADQLPNNQVTPGAQKGVDAKGEPPIYLPKGRWTGKTQRTWGASSNHPEGVGHAFADGHAAMLSRNIDPVVYLHLTSRNGRELIDVNAFK